jgi:hypothetical protein
MGRRVIVRLAVIGALGPWCFAGVLSDVEFDGPHRRGGRRGREVVLLGVGSSAAAFGNRNTVVRLM